MKSARSYIVCAALLAAASCCMWEKLESVVLLKGYRVTMDLGNFQAYREGV